MTINIEDGVHAKNACTFHNEHNNLAYVIFVLSSTSDV